MSSIIVFHLLLLGLFIGETFSQLEIDQTIFLQPGKNFAFIRCPLENVTNLDIQWWDGSQQRYESNQGRYYRIEGAGESSRQLMCSSRFNENYKVKFNLRIYGKFMGRIFTVR